MFSPRSTRYRVARSDGYRVQQPNKQQKEGLTTRFQENHDDGYSYANIDFYAKYLKLELFCTSFQKAAAKVYCSTVCKLPDFHDMRKQTEKESPK